MVVWLGVGGSVLECVFVCVCVWRTRWDGRVGWYKRRHFLIVMAGTAVMDTGIFVGTDSCFVKGGGRGVGKEGMCVMGGGTGVGTKGMSARVCV